MNHNSHHSSNSADFPVRPQRWRRAAVATSIILGMVFSGLAGLPVAIMNSTHRDDLLASYFQQHGLIVTSGEGSGGWSTPVVLKDVLIRDETGRVECHIAELRTSKTISALIFHGGDLGTITAVEPTLKVALDEDGQLPPGLFANEESAPNDGPTVKVVLQDAGFSLTVPWRQLPIVDLQQMDISAAVLRRDGQRWLDVDPVQVMKRYRISDAEAEQNLALVAPILSQSTRLTGEVSVLLNGIQIPLDKEENAWPVLSGQATFHSVEARLKHDWVTSILQSLGRRQGAEIPDHLQIVRDSAVDFSVDDAGIHHTGLAFLLPQLMGNMHVVSSGTVGLDESLSLVFGVQLPQLTSSNPVMSALSRLSSLPFQMQVRGSVANPELVMPEGMSLADQMAHHLHPERPPSEPPPVANSVVTLMAVGATDDPEQQTTRLLNGVLNLIRAGERARETATDDESASAAKAEKLRLKQKRQQKRAELRARRQSL